MKKLKIQEKYEKMTTEELEAELKWLKKQYYAKENRTYEGKQTAEGFRLYGEPMFAIKRILEERRK